MTDTAALIEGLKRGESAAFKNLILLYGPRLLGKAQTMLGNLDDAQECVQECYIQVHRNIRQFRGEAELYSWMYRILINACLKKMRGRSHIPLEPLDDLLPKFDDDGCRIEPLWQRLPTAEELLDENQTKQHVLTAIQSLPAIHRDVLYLRDIEGHSTAEVAELLDLSVSAVKVRLHRARAVLKKLLEPVFLERQKP